MPFVIHRELHHLHTTWWRGASKCSETRRPHSCQLGKRLKFTPAHPNWIIKACKMLSGEMSLYFCGAVQVAPPELGVNNMKVWYYPPLHTVMQLSTAAADLHVDHSRSTPTWRLPAGHRTELKSPHTGWVHTTGSFNHFWRHKNKHPAFKCEFFNLQLLLRCSPVPPSMLN